MSYYRSRSQVRTFDESPRVVYKPRSSSHDDIYRGIVSADIAMYTPSNYSSENSKRQRRTQNTKNRFLPGRTYISSTLTAEDLESGAAYRPRATYTAGVVGASAARPPICRPVLGSTYGFRPTRPISGSAFAAILRSRLQTHKNSPGSRVIPGVVTLYRRTY